MKEDFTVNPSLKEGNESQQILRVLILEDIKSDVELIKIQFDEFEFKPEFSIVQTREAYLEAIHGFHPDIIISDYNLPKFNGFRALTILRQEMEDNITPFIFLTGTLGEEIAVKAIKGGATDFLIKNKINQLPVAILKALREKDEKINRKVADAREQKNKRRFKKLVQASSDFIVITDMKGSITFVSNSYARLLGYTSEDLLGNDLSQFIHPDDKKPLVDIHSIKEGAWIRIKYRFLDAEKKWHWLQTIITNMNNDADVAGFVFNSSDVTELIETEADLRKSIQRFEFASKASRDAIYEWNCRKDEIIWSEGYQQAFGYGDLTTTLGEWKSNVHELDQQRVEQSLQAFLDDPGLNFWNCEYRYFRKNKKVAFVEERGYIIRDDKGFPITMIGTINDQTEKRAYQDQLLENTIQSEEKERNRIAQELHDGIVQELVVCSRRCEQIQYLDRTSSVFEEKMKEFSKHIKEITEGIRNVSHNLYSANVKTMPLVGLLERLALNLRIGSKIRFNVEHFISPEIKIQEAVKINLYRVIQELSNNIIKHSGATEAQIIVGKVKNSLTLMVTDNGKGIDQDEKIKGIGLSNVYNRIQFIGGTINFNNNEDGGLSVNITVPLT